MLAARHDDDDDDDGFYGISTIVYGVAHSVMIIVVENGHGDTSSNPG